MTEIVINDLIEDVDNGIKYKEALVEIEDELQQQGQSFNIETLLSNIDEKVRIIGIGTLNKLSKEEFCAIGSKIRSKIRDIVSVHKDIYYLLRTGDKTALAYLNIQTGNVYRL